MARETRARLVNLSRLPPERKEAAWGWIRQHRPELAEMLAHDENLKAIVRAFDAEILIEVPKP